MCVFWAEGEFGITFVVVLFFGVLFWFVFFFFFIYLTHVLTHLVLVVHLHL